jgi:hypothetical protein
VRVARQAGEQRLRPGEGRLGVDHPVFFRTGDRCRRNARRSARCASDPKKASRRASCSARPAGSGTTGGIACREPSSGTGRPRAVMFNAFRPARCRRPVRSCGHADVVSVPSPKCGARR